MAEAAKTTADDLVVTLTREQLRVLIENTVTAAISNANAAPGYLTLDQLAEQLQVSTKTIVNTYVRAGGMPAIRLGNEWRFDRTVVREWLAAEAARPGAHVSKHTSRAKRLDK